MKRQLLLLAVLLLSGAAFAANDDAKPGFDKRIDAWAFGSITGVNLDNGYIAVEGQVSDQAIQYSKHVEGSLAGAESPTSETLKQLRARIAKLDKKEIVLNFNKSAPPALLQAFLKDTETTKPDSRSQISELKIGDIVLVGYDAEPKTNMLYAVVLVEPAKNPNEDPIRAKGKE